MTLKNLSMPWTGALLLGLLAAGCGDDPVDTDPQECPAEQALCEGAADVCADLDHDPDHCGACGTACETGEACVEGTCTELGTVGCPTGLTDCGGSCVDLDSNPDFCGTCDTVCTFDDAAGACFEGSCLLAVCDDGYFDSDGDDANGCEACGAEDTLCGISETCTDAECIVTEPVPASWKIAELSTEGCVANPGHEGITGDDNGGIAVGRAGMYYNGDDQLAGFDFERASTTVIGPTEVDGIFSDLATGQLYALTIGGELFEDGNCDPIDGFIAIDEATLAPTGTATPLSSTFTTCGDGEGDAGMFAGMGMLIVHNTTQSFEIDLATGDVTDLGTTLDLTGAENSENWSIWGVAEKFGGDSYVVFRCDNCTADSIVRRKVSDNTDEVLLDLAALEEETGGDASDIATITIDPRRSLWIYHGEDTEEMLGVVGDSSEEVIGHCPAVIEFPVE